MTASRDSINQIADILVEYLIQERYDYISIAARLQQVEGNKSLKESCELLAAEIVKRAPAA